MTALNANVSTFYNHVFVSVEALIRIRSLASELLMVAHTLRHVEMKKEAGEATPSPL